MNSRAGKTGACMICTEFEAKGKWTLDTYPM
jgi:hypothetical protein